MGSNLAPHHSAVPRYIMPGGFIPAVTLPNSSSCVFFAVCGALLTAPTRRRGEALLF